MSSIRWQCTQIVDKSSRHDSSAGIVKFECVSATNSVSRSNPSLSTLSAAPISTAVRVLIDEDASNDAKLPKLFHPMSKTIALSSPCGRLEEEKLVLPPVTDRYGPQEFQLNVYKRKHIKAEDLHKPAAAEAMEELAEAKHKAMPLRPQLGAKAANRWLIAMKQWMEKRRTFQRIRVQDADEEKKFKQMFDDLDVNHDGSIDMDELRVALETLGVNLDIDELRERMRLMDINVDGSISYPEFLHGLLDHNEWKSIYEFRRARAAKAAAVMRARVKHSAPRRSQKREHGTSTTGAGTTAFGGYMSAATAAHHSYKRRGSVTARGRDLPFSLWLPIYSRHKMLERTMKSVEADDDRVLRRMSYALIQPDQYEPAEALANSAAALEVKSSSAALATPVTSSPAGLTIPTAANALASTPTHLRQRSCMEGPGTPKPPMAERAHSITWGSRARHAVVSTRTGTGRPTHLSAGMPQHMRTLSTMSAVSGFSRVSTYVPQTNENALAKADDNAHVASDNLFPQRSTTMLSEAQVAFNNHASTDMKEAASSTAQSPRDNSVHAHSIDAAGASADAQTITAMILSGQFAPQVTRRPAPMIPESLTSFRLFSEAALSPRGLATAHTAGESLQSASDDLLDARFARLAAHRPKEASPRSRLPVVTDRNTMTRESKRAARGAATKQATTIRATEIPMPSRETGVAVSSPSARLSVCIDAAAYQINGTFSLSPADATATKCSESVLNASTNSTRPRPQPLLLQRIAQNQTLDPCSPRSRLGLSEPLSPRSSIMAVPVPLSPLGRSDADDARKASTFNAGLSLVELWHKTLQEVGGVNQN